MVQPEAGWPRARSPLALTCCGGQCVQLVCDGPGQRRGSLRPPVGFMSTIVTWDKLVAKSPPCMVAAGDSHAEVSSFFLCLRPLTACHPPSVSV